jgi:hypothetical protein
MVVLAGKAQNSRSTVYPNPVSFMCTWFSTYKPSRSVSPPLHMAVCRLLCVRFYTTSLTAVVVQWLYSLTNVGCPGYLAVYLCISWRCTFPVFLYPQVPIPTCSQQYYQSHSHVICLNFRKGTGNNSWSNDSSGGWSLFTLSCQIIFS